jgi:hypothetical protein
MKGKSPPIDLMKLILQILDDQGEQWNKYLRRSRRKQDIAGLTDTLHRVQVGMDNLAKAKLNTEQVAAIFVRIQRSIENTIREIIKEKIPSVHDDPLSQHHSPKLLELKRERDRDIEKFLRKNSF